MFSEFKCIELPSKCPDISLKCNKHVHTYFSLSKIQELFLKSIFNNQVYSFQSETIHITKPDTRKFVPIQSLVAAVQYSLKIDCNDLEKTVSYHVFTCHSTQKVHFDVFFFCMHFQRTSYFQEIRLSIFIKDINKTQKSLHKVFVTILFNSHFYCISVLLDGAK